MIHLNVCVAGQPIGIVLALRQEGIPFFEESDMRAIHSYIEEGGIVVGLQAAEAGSDLIYKRRYVKVYKKGKGCFVYIDKELDRELINHNSTIKEFITTAGTIREKVALFPKKDAREELSRAIAAAFYLRNLPFIRLWYYPHSYKSLFNFRFDLDEDTGNDLENIAKASGNYKDCTTWFTCCASYERNFCKIENLIKNGFDVQSHGYYHHTYSEKLQNDDNIDKSLRYFQRFDYPIEGFAAPKGRWNNGLQRALEERGFLYSSEFSLDYDNFPFYPVLEGGFSGVLQIPIHPICWGLYADAGIDNDDAIKRYMINVISKKYDYNLPVIMYGHPGERIAGNTKLLEDIYKRIDSLEGLWKVKLSELAKWWNKRNNIKFKNLSFDTGKLVLRYKVEDNIDFSSACLCIHTTAGKRAFYEIVKQEEDVCLGQAAYETFNEPLAMPEIYKTRLWKMPYIKRIKEYVARALDWEKNTPLSELKRDTMASNLKYFLRKLI